MNAQEPIHANAAASSESLPPAPPPRPRAPTALVVLATLAVGYTLWAAQALLLPILLAMFFALVGNPILRGLRRLWIPRFIGALLLLLFGLAAAVMLGRQLIVPASEWVQQAPKELRLLAPKIKQMTQPMQQANQAAQTFAQVTTSDRKPPKVQVVTIQDADPWKSLTATPKMLASVLAVVLLTFFFMVFGENLQRNAIALLPTRQRKKITVGILQAIEREISRYVFTITVINTAVGMILAAALHWLGVELPEALLWGTLAALLNFAPYVGPLIGVVLMLLMGFITYDEIGPSLLPAAIYLGLHTLEGQIITPIILGRRMALSPLILILALMLFGWLWGIIGLLLAVPLLVCVKLVLARIEGLEGWARLLE
ncbi:MAG TPA: AI-2E family transporter [Luteimonas sp.]|nr:AI-2E family transporter [Luteimonas sp.]